MNDDYYGYIYLTTNLITKKMYIGQHRGKFNARYLGSGLLIKRSIKKYNRENFKVELLDIANNYEELNQLERKYISKYNAVESDKFYNLDTGGSGGKKYFIHHSEATKQKQSVSHIKHWENNIEKRKKYSEMMSKSNAPQSRRIVKLIIEDDRLLPIKKYDYIKQVELDTYYNKKIKKYKNLNHSLISHCCRYEYRHKTAYGYVWLYEEEYMRIKNEDETIDKNIWLSQYENNEG